MTEKTIAESSRRGNEVREDEIDLLMLASHFLEHAKFMVLHFFLGDFNKRTNLHRSATA